MKTPSKVAHLILTTVAVLLHNAAPVSAERDWAKMLHDGTEALDSNKYWIAEPLLKQAAVQAGAFGYEDVRLAKSLGELGRLYTIRGRFDVAEPYLEEELAAREQALGPANADSIKNRGALIRFYLLHGTTSKAEPATEELLEILHGKLKEALPTAKGKVKLQQGVPLTGHAATAALTMRDPLIEWAITCDDIGNIYRSQKKFEMAERLFKEALEIKSSVLGSEHLSLANSYDNLGELCLAKEQVSDAQYFFEDSLAITEKILQPENSQVYGRLDKLAKCLIKQGKYSEAEQLYIRAQEFWKSEPSKSGDEGKALFALGSLYADQKKFDSAAPILQKALEFAEKFHGQESINVVPYMQRLAYTLYYLDRKPETEILKARFNAILGTVPPTSVAGGKAIAN